VRIVDLADRDEGLGGGFSQYQFAEADEHQDDGNQAESSGPEHRSLDREQEYREHLRENGFGRQPRSGGQRREFFQWSDCSRRT